ncbi:winged helix-turn-helix domain-containing protein (plasmid) [Salinirubellus salinus]|uniref:Winged helix-turn-helix domain-containing protein n=2 Tax=Salinirubellus salinus TaxID=1364945 RepID=A0A9E7R9D2_9EURY|nr:winged helix-turn-helix domain-containing protein [Salinirubellus salinus]UWM56980.1 winged helix-turn-helix domain-containing protein [Salinirubellus salinus]
MSGRERVRAVVETLDQPATVVEITDRADVSRNTASSELERLEAENRVRSVQVDGQQGYELDPVRLFLDEIMALIKQNSRESLESELEDLKRERESLQEEFEVDSLTVFRERLAEEEDLSAADVREIRNVAATWDTLNTEIKLVRHALRLYEDVSMLSTGESSVAPAL